MWSRSSTCSMSMSSSSIWLQNELFLSILSLTIDCDWLLLSNANEYSEFGGDIVGGETRWWWLNDMDDSSLDCGMSLAKPGEATESEISSEFEVRGGVTEFVCWIICRLKWIL